MGDRQRVVVTGTGIVCPAGDSVATCRDGLFSGVSGIAPNGLFSTGRHGSQALAVCGLPQLAGQLRLPKNLKYMTRGVQCLMAAALEAVRQVGGCFAAGNPNRIGVHLGSGQTGIDAMDFLPALNVAWEKKSFSERDYALLGGVPSRMLDPYFSIRTLSNAGVGLLTAELKLRGPANNYVHTDAASLHAIQAAVIDLEENRCDFVLAGGYDSLVGETNYLAYLEAGVLSSLPAESAQRPFDRRADGVVLGEGAGVFVLERLETALARGATILAEVTGTAIGFAPQDSQVPVYDATLAQSLGGAACRGENPDWIVARGISLPDADRTEAEALHAAYPGVPVTALKGRTGYMGAATGAVEAVMAVQMLAARSVAPVLRLEEPAPLPPVPLVLGSPLPIENPAPLALCFTQSFAGAAAAIGLRSWTA